MQPLRPGFVIAVGAIVGANLRYAVSGWMAKHLTPAFPYGTLAINSTGSLILGFFLVWTIERVLASPEWRLLVAVGFCGSYTTFSSYAFETFAMLEQGRFWDAGVNFVSNNAVSLLGTILGAAIARAIE